MYRVIVSFYGTLYKHDDRQYIIECIKAEEAFKRLQKEIRKEYGKDAEECWTEMQKHSPFGWIKNSYGHFEITGIKKEGVCFGVANNFHGYEYPFTDYLFADGTPFGIKEDGTKTE